MIAEGLWSASASETHNKLMNEVERESVGVGPYCLFDWRTLGCYSTRRTGLVAKTTKNIQGSPRRSAAASKHTHAIQEAKNYQEGV